MRRSNMTDSIRQIMQDLGVSPDDFIDLTANSVTLDSTSPMCRVTVFARDKDGARFSIANDHDGPVMATATLWAAWPL